jgi:hypothetical protein
MARNVHSGKPGAKSVNPSSKGKGFAGNPGKVVAQSPIPGPSSPGQPVAMKKALAKKQVKGGPVTGFAGTVR